MHATVATSRCVAHRIEKFGRALDVLRSHVLRPLHVTRRASVARSFENRFERENDDFYRRIHRAYETIAAREPGRVVPVRDDASIEQIENRIRDIVSARIPANVI